MDAAKKSAFDRLVAGLSSEERTAMLLRLNSPDMKNVEFLDHGEHFDKFEGTLVLRLKNESPFYKFVLWLRSIFSKTPVQTVYNDDVLTSLARKINREHPGLLNPHAKLLDSLFHEQLTSLKTVADFFKPFFHKIEENPGAFYVFLSSFVAPQISEKINTKVDPYNLDMSNEPTPEVRTMLIKSLDDILKNLPGASRDSMYEAVKSVQWLQSFVSLPFIHFIAQFTDLTDSSFTCPYQNAKIDYETFASVLDNRTSISNEVLEAIFLFSQKSDLTPDLYDSDVEKAVKNFMSVATQNLSGIKLFLSVVPITTMGKIIFADYDWSSNPHGGGEDWFNKFRLHWRKIFDIRWTEYVRDRKKTILGARLSEDFGLDAFPEMPIRPWASIWGGVQFAFEMTGGLLAWYCDEKFQEDQAILNTVIMEGVFMKNDNRSEFAEATNMFDQAVNNMINLMEKIDLKGQYGAVFNELEGSSSRTFKSQSKVDSMITSIESEVREISEQFCKAVRIMEIVFKGIFNELQDGFHASLQNLNTLKSHSNLKFKDELANVRHNLNQMLYYLSELQPIEIDAASGN